MLVSSLFFSLIAVNPPFQRVWARPDADGPSPQIAVTVQGAVARPGVYRVTPGLLVKELLVQAGLLKGADLSGFSLRRPLCAEETLDVPLRKRKSLSYASPSKVERNA
jgi:DNA uptake protein ComE-like DNA-binding protein